MKRFFTTATFCLFVSLLTLQESPAPIVEEEKPTPAPVSETTATPIAKPKVRKTKAKAAEAGIEKVKAAEQAKKSRPADGRWVLQTQLKETSGWTSHFDTTISISGKHAEYTSMTVKTMPRGGAPFHGASRVSYRFIEDCDAVSTNGNIVSILWTNKRITDCNPSNLRAAILDLETEWLQRKTPAMYHLDGDDLVSDRDQAVFRRAK
jgi:hypothetical protein